MRLSIERYFLIPAVLFFLLANLGVVDYAVADKEAIEKATKFLLAHQMKTVAGL